MKTKKAILLGCFSVASMLVLFRHACFAESGHSRAPGQSAGVGSKSGQIAKREPLRLTYVANMGVMVSSGGFKVLIDSLFDKPSQHYRLPSPGTLQAIMKGHEPFAGIDLVLATHNHPGGPKFSQRLFLSHRDFAKPVVLETEGYGAPWPKERELARILGANQVIVEHRYYESSRPNPLKWEYLTSWQAASDHHRIVGIFRAIYPGKWV